MLIGLLSKVSEHGFEVILIIIDKVLTNVKLVRKYLQEMNQKLRMIDSHVAELKLLKSFTYNRYIFHIFFITFIINFFCRALFKKTIIYKVQS